MLRFVVPPEPAPIDPLGAGSYSAPAMWDDDDWASPTPCCLEWEMRKVAALAVEGRVDVCCAKCGKAWEVVWDPWKPDGRGHAVWIDG